MYALTGGRLTALRFAGLGLTLCGLAWLLWRVRRVTPLLVLPFACSIYVLCSSAWLLPDDAAWLLLGGLMFLTIRTRWTTATFVTAAGLMTLVVFTRQIHAWVMLPVVLSAAVKQTDACRPRIDWRGGLIGLAACVPALAVLGAMVVTWHGLVPPLYSAEVGPGPLKQITLDHQGANPALPALFFGVLGVAGVFFVPFWTRRVTAALRWTLWLPVAAALTAVVSVVPATSYVFAPRASGLWNVVKHFPTVHDRSVVMPVFCFAGALVMLGWLRTMTPRSRVIAIGTVMGFLLANSMNSVAWQRYVEPFVLLLLAVWAVQACEAETDRTTLHRGGRTTGGAAHAVGAAARGHRRQRGPRPVQPGGDVGGQTPTPVFLKTPAELREMLDAERVR